MDFFAIALTVLLVLAVVDLSVGVSNDAVNFMNSAVGSQVASRRALLLLVCAGVIIGAVFSSGIMQVARSGIINPEMFTFADVMVVFLAVMLADVLLLDIYNTYGLPTSTTVSIVFELLGAATAVAIIHVATHSDASFIDFINARSALTILSGIGLSIGIAFVVGLLIQFLSRMLFTFEDRPGSAATRVVWSGLALTLITQFLFIKGLRGTGLITAETVAYVSAHTIPLMAGMFVIWLTISALLQRAGTNPLKFTVLAGTFSLAMAFASNDLVNFIGVPLAGLESWRAWSASGVAADTFLMSDLSRPVTGNTAFLLAAGMVMAATLWFSGRAQTVTQTEVNLGRQDEGAERFQPGPVSRGVVRVFLRAADQIRILTPLRMQAIIGERYQRTVPVSPLPDGPAFDLVRASVNLTVASVLIAIATAWKLPLSTTFVTFMVAMGASLADRAWGRESAAYRVAGVLSVLSGWFVTAAAAFLLAALFAVILKAAGGFGLAFLVLLVGWALFRTFRSHGARVNRDARVRARTAHAADYEHQVHLLQAQLAGLLHECSGCLDLAIRGLIQGDRRLLEQANQRVGELKDSCVSKEGNFVRVLKVAQPDVDSVLLGHMKLLSCQQDLFQSVQTIVDSARTHVLDAHERLTGATERMLHQFNAEQRNVIERQASAWDSAGEHERIGAQIDGMRGLLTDSIRAAVNDLYGNVRPVNFTTLLLTLLTELEDFARALERARALWSDHARPSS